MNAPSRVFANHWNGGDITINMERRAPHWTCQPANFCRNGNTVPWIYTCYELTNRIHPPCIDCNMVGAGELLFNELMDRMRKEQAHA